MDKMILKIFERIEGIEARLAKLEAGEPATVPDPPAPTSEVKTTTEPKIINRSIPYEDRTDLKPEPEKKGRNFLGFVGVACILLASLLLIKFSVDSGWLTPFRQLVLASLFGSSLIIVPFFVHFEDKKYMSQMPAMGVVILNLVVYGAVFYHMMMPPLIGLVCLSMISLLSLWLLVKIEEDLYAGLSIIGTYLGAFFLSSVFDNIFVMGSYLLLWDITFTLFAINLKRRQIIAIASYFALGIVAFWGLGAMERELYEILVLQAIQFGIFANGTALYSTRNRVPLTEKEAWRFFPVIIFFYGQEYFFLNALNKHYATAFAVLFSLFLLGIYKLASNKLKKKELESRGVVFSSLAIMFGHAIYLNEFNDIGRIVFSLLLLGGMAFWKSVNTESKIYKGTKITVGLMLLFSYFTVLFEQHRIDGVILLISGALFGLLGLILAPKLKSTKGSLVMYMAHIQVFLSIYRLKVYLPDIFITPLWVAYSFCILYWAVRKVDVEMAKGAIPLVVISLSRFVFFEFFDLGTLQKIASLFVMGGLIFAGGYLYRKVVKN